MMITMIAWTNEDETTKNEDGWKKDWKWKIIIIIKVKTKAK